MSNPNYLSPHLEKELEDDSDKELSRYERIQNIYYPMFGLAGASVQHERLVANIMFQLMTYFQNKPCQVFPSNIAYSWSDLLEEKGFITKNEKPQRFMPDISVQCQEEGFYSEEAIPKLIVEVVSPSSYERDLVIKKEAFELIGVQEYWVVVMPNAVHRFRLEDGHYKQKIFLLKENITLIQSLCFEGLEVTIEQDR